MAVSKGVKESWKYLTGGDVPTKRKSEEYVLYEGFEARWRALELDKQSDGVGAWLMAYADRYGEVGAKRLLELVVGEPMEERYWWLLVTYGGWGGVDLEWAMTVTRAFIGLSRTEPKAEPKKKPAKERESSE